MGNPVWSLMPAEYGYFSAPHGSKNGEGARECLVRDQDLRIKLDLSRFRAAPSARLGHLPFERQGAFPA